MNNPSLLNIIYCVCKGLLKYTVWRLEVLTEYLSLSCCIPFSKAGALSVNLKVAILARRQASKPPGPACLCLSCSSMLGLQICATVLGFYMEAEAPNSGPYGLQLPRLVTLLGFADHPF